MSASRLDLILESELLFLRELLAAPHGVAAMLSAPPPFDRQRFADGGRWRGDVPRALARRGIIAPVTADASALAVSAKRPSRNATVVRLWKLLDRAAAVKRVAELVAGRKRPANRTLFDGYDD